MSIETGKSDINDVDEQSVPDDGQTGGSCDPGIAIRQLKY